jgi:hypothetical protein
LENVVLLSFVAGVARFQAVTSQGLTSSAIGDTLYSIYSSTTNMSIDDNLGNQTQVYKELVSFMFEGPYLPQVCAFLRRNIGVALLSFLPQ